MDQSQELSVTPAGAEGRELWKSEGRMAKERAIVVLVSALTGTVAVEAIRVAVVALASGYSVPIFGIFPSRELGVPDALGVCAVAAAGLAYVLYNLGQIILRGLPARLVLFERVDAEPAEAGEAAAAADETACLRVEFDGALKPVRHVFFSDITAVEAIARGTMGGGGHQVRVRVAGRRRSRLVARFETAAEADALAGSLRQIRDRVLKLDADLDR